MKKRAHSETEADAPSKTPSTSASRSRTNACSLAGGFSGFHLRDGKKQVMWPVWSVSRIIQIFTFMISVKQVYMKSFSGAERQDVAHQTEVRTTKDAREGRL